MRENKYKYYWQHDETGRIVSKIFTLIEIESGIINVWNNKLSRYGEPFKRAGYTGLKDKNGVEIYEGDIMFLENWNDHISDRFNIPLHETRKVSFADGGFTLIALDDDNFCSICYMNTEFAEVIGNIYENPELLEAEQ